jgi:hypothetical protein
MGATLNSTAAINAYTLTDRATWVKRNGQGLEILTEIDPGLFNSYGSMRRRIAHPRLRTTPIFKVGLQQGIAAGGMGLSTQFALQKS